MTAELEKTLRAENARLRERLAQAEEVLQALRAGEIEPAPGTQTLQEGEGVGPMAEARECGRESEDARERLAAIVHSSDDAFVSKTLEGIITSWNPGAERMFGYEAGEIVGKPALTLIPPERVLEEADILRRVGLGMIVESFETVRLRKDGKRLDAAVTISPIRDGTGRIVGASKIARDITRQKEAEERLRRSEEIHRVAFDLGPIGMVYLGTDGRFIQVNQKYCEITGYTTAELLGRTPGEITHPEDVAENQGQFNAVLSGQRDGYNSEKRYVRKDGGVCWVHVTAQLIFDAHGQPLHTIGVIQDITARKAAEETISRQAAELKTLYATAPVGLFQFNENLEFIRVNDLMAELNGLPAEAHIGRALGEVIAPGLAGEIEPLLRHVMQTGEPLRELEVHGATIPRPEEQRDWLVSYFPLKDGSGTVRGIHGVVQEISARKRAEAARKTSEERFALGVAVAGLALAEIDYTSGLNHLSTEAAQLFGLGQEALVVPRAAVHATFHPEDRRKLEEGIAGCLAPDGGGCFAMDHRVVWPDGAVRWLRVRKQVFFEGEGAARRPVRGALAALDITSERNATEAVRRSEAFVLGVLNSLPEHVVVLDKSGVIVAVNEPWENFARENGGTECTLSVGVNYLDVCRRSSEAGDPYGREALAGLVAVLAGERESCQMEYPCHGPQGERWFLMHAQRPLYSEGGLILSHVDITQRMRAEAAIRDSELRLRLATETSSMGIWEWNLHTHRVLWDAEMFRIYGVEPTPDGFVDYSVWRQAVLPEDLLHNEAIMDETVRSLGTSRREFRIRRAGGGMPFH